MNAKKYIAVTFDDGPNCNTTADVLDVLEEFCVPASFFLIGQNIKKECVPIVERQLALGCTVECHSWSHLHMGTLDAKQIEDEVLRADKAIEEIAGRVPEFFRPPYIDVSQTLFDCVEKPFICGSDCRDWEESVSADERVRMILDSAKNGQILLLHDSDGNAKTVDALRTVIPLLASRGFTFVTVPELFRVCGVNPRVRNKIWSNVFEQ